MIEMNDLKVTVVQCDLVWENRSANFAHISALLDQAEEESDIILLPEMFTTGFTMNTSEAAESHHDDMDTLRWMRSESMKRNAVVCGSVSVSEQNHFYNRLYWVRPNGTYSTYDKRHTFSFAGEDRHYERGQQRLVEEWKEWKICPLICYDLRFPVWSRNGLHHASPLYDVLIYVANWPEARREPWMKLLPARAIENQVYVAACNRIGSDGKGIAYSGDSMMINPRGEVMQQAKPGKEELLHAVFSKHELQDFREKFPVLHDADAFRLG